MIARLTNIPDFNSSDETDKETVLSLLPREEESDEEEDSQQLNNLTKFTVGQPHSTCF